MGARGRAGPAGHVNPAHSRPDRRVLPAGRRSRSGGLPESLLHRGEGRVGKAGDLRVRAHRRHTPGQQPIVRCARLPVPRARARQRVAGGRRGAAHAAVARAGRWVPVRADVAC